MVVENNEFQLSNVFGYKKVVKTSARRTKISLENIKHKTLYYMREKANQSLKR